MEISGNRQGGQATPYENVISESKANPINASLGKLDSSSSNADEKPINEPELKKATDKLNKFFEDDNVMVVYDIHPKFRDIMIKIVDRNTGNVITEVPPKKILDMVAKMCELAGVIFDKRA